MSLYRLSIKCLEMTREEFDKSFNPPLVMTFDHPPADHTEDWTADLYPEQVKDRLRAGIARYLRSDSSVSR